MVTASHIAKNIVKRRPFLEEALSRGLINYGALADFLKPEIEKELGKTVDRAAILMALRRLKDELEKSFVRQAPVKFRESDITIKSDLIEFTYLKSHSIIDSIRKLYDSIDFSKGDFLTITHGLYEITIIASKKYKIKIEKVFSSERLVKEISGLSSLTVRIPEDAVNTIGLFYVLTKAINWENIPIVEIVSTLTELTFILKEDDISRAFGVIKGVISESG